MNPSRTRSLWFALLVTIPLAGFLVAGRYATPSTSGVEVALADPKPGIIETPFAAASVDFVIRNRSDAPVQLADGGSAACSCLPLSLDATTLAPGESTRAVVHPRPAAVGIVRSIAFLRIVDSDGHVERRRLTCAVTYAPRPGFFVEPLQVRADRGSLQIHGSLLLHRPNSTSWNDAVVRLRWGNRTRRIRPRNWDIRGHVDVRVFALDWWLRDTGPQDVEWEKELEITLEGDEGYSTSVRPVWAGS